MHPNSSANAGKAIEFRTVELPEGAFLLDAATDTRIRAASGALERRGEFAHPIFAFVMGIGGLGVAVADAIAMSGCSIESGPLLASCEIDIHHPFKVGAAYQVSGRITEKERKSSRRFGFADHLLFSIGISHEKTHFADLHLRMIVPVVPE